MFARDMDSKPRNGRPWVVTSALLCSIVLSNGTRLSASSPSPRRSPHPSPPTVDLSAACPGERWIGVLNKQPRENWWHSNKREGKSDKRAYLRDWRPLFSSSEGRVPPGLRRFLVYEGPDPRKRLAVIDQEGRVYYDPAKSVARRPFARANRSDFKKKRRDFFERIDQDCRVVGPAAETLFPPREVSSALADRFLQNVGQAPQARQASRSDRVRLVIIDSVQDSRAPDRERCPQTSRVGDLECSNHGVVLANLARTLLRDTIQIWARRALTRTYRIKPAGPPKEVALDISNAPRTGGLYGYWSELGDAIWRAVDSQGVKSGKTKLILNLSVGWESIYGRDVAPVRAAIETAVCRGALVVAASGNRRAGPQAFANPLLPAAWEQEKAPSDARCALLLGKEQFTPPPGGSDYRPLLYAVSGIQEDGKILSTAKPSAVPRLVAFGDHASVFMPSAKRGEPDRLATLTGTSVSALVVSAAAAVEWNRNTARSSFAVMDALWQSAENNGEELIGLDRTVDFCLDPKRNCPPGTFSRRISVGPRPATLSRFQQPVQADRIPPDRTRLIELSGAVNLLDCDPQVLSYQGASLPTGELCPQRRLFDIAAQPWLGPQPGPNHNPDCTYVENSPGTLILEFQPCFRYQGKPVKLDDFTLVAGNVAYRLPIDSFTLGEPSPACPLGDDPRRVQVILKSSYLEGLHPMYIAATVNGDYAVVTPLLQVLKEDG